VTAVPFQKIDARSTYALNYETNIRYGMLQNVWVISTETVDVYLQLSESGVVLGQRCLYSK
jgi:hypothetical protein